MFLVWESRASRSTINIDMLGKMKNNPEVVIATVREICRQKVEPDGVVFDTESVRGERITEGADYEGVRIRFRGSLDTARIAIQLDVGFGDHVIPSPRRVSYPTILDLPAPRVRGYSRESTIAEKFEAMVRHGAMNSRMKDFWDMRLLSRQFDFDGKTLAMAVAKTFATRHTTVPADPVAFTEAFIRDEKKQAQWKAFLRKIRMSDDPDAFADAVYAVSSFLKPVVDHLVNHRPVPTIWKAPGPWQA
jgi:hypothetical protein